MGVMDIVKLDKEKFRLGHTLVFFRAGIGGWMEEQRENKIGSVLAWLQSGARGKSYMMAKTWLWLQLWLAIKPNLRCSQFGKFKKEYEDRIAEAEANIDGAVQARSKVQAVYDGLAAQKNELQLALNSGGSAVQDMIDKAVRIENQAADVQKDLDQTNARIKNEKAQKVAFEGTMAKTNATVAQLESEVAVQEGHLSKAEQDRADKDDQIRTLKDEIAHQGDMITKLGKEKRSCADGRQKTEEDIQAAEDKCNHLSRVKGKLEQALDEAEDALEREKKVKGDIEKSERKVEGDLKLTQEAVSDLERVKGELHGAAARKDEELAVERGNRSKAEKSRTMLKKDIEDIASRLEEAGSNTATQVELNKKREGELARLKSELEELNIAHEGTQISVEIRRKSDILEPTHYPTVKI